MFTGIIEAMGTIRKLSADRTNKTSGLKATLSSHLKIDESLCHNGVCLTSGRY